MARKRQNLKNLDYHSQAYWEKVLQEDGLSMERGTSRRLTYVGGATVLEGIEAEIVGGGRIGDKGKDVTYQNSDSGE